jgi:hypothetical protein
VCNRVPQLSLLQVERNKHQKHVESGAKHYADFRLHGGVWFWFWFVFASQTGFVFLVLVVRTDALVDVKEVQHESDDGVANQVVKRLQVPAPHRLEASQKNDDEAKLE